MLVLKPEKPSNNIFPSLVSKSVPVLYLTTVCPSNHNFYFICRPSARVLNLPFIFTHLPFFSLLCSHLAFRIAADYLKVTYSNQGTRIRKPWLSKDFPQRSVHPSCIVNVVLMSGLLGQQARESLLLCVSLASKNSALEQYIVHQSNFCTILATGTDICYIIAF